MKINFSRHAKRRAKLYGISESAIENFLSDLDFKNGEYELIENFTEFNYPIKIVVSVESEIITVITSYPLKKGIKK